MTAGSGGSLAAVSGASVAELRSTVAAGLGHARTLLGAGDVVEWRGAGRLVRPTLAYEAARRLRLPVDDRFWLAALAVQLVHDASLIHDDVVDGARQRRGEATYVARHGTAAALLYGDRLLTAAYGAAAAAGSMAFMRLFASSVDAMVAAERDHTKALGRRLERSEYETVVAGKTGRLLGVALAASASMEGDDRASALAGLGLKAGLAYQMLDDLLDYSPSSRTGKAAYADYSERRWTWVLDHLPGARLGGDARVVGEALFRPAGGGPSPARRALEEWRGVLEDARARAVELLGEASVLVGLLDGWWREGESAVGIEEGKGGARLVTAPAPVPAAGGLHSAVGDDWRRRMERHSRSFSFASWFAPAAERRRIQGVYAFCRITDDLVDEADGASRASLDGALGEWLALSHAAYRGQPTGIGLLDEVMGDMSAAGVPVRYVDELVEGMRMDLEDRGYRDLAELQVYTYRVASVVGLWLTELFGVHDAWALGRAEALGHAMQLTNILRDVGEDLERGRVYLPDNMLAAHGLGREELHAMRQGRSRIGPAYRGLMEELMAVADRDYALAFQAIPALPRFFQPPVAVAARVYQGIHREMRANGYDNLTRRAYTRPLRKAHLAVRALLELRRERRRWREAHHPTPTLPRPVLEGGQP